MNLWYRNSLQSGFESLCLIVFGIFREGLSKEYDEYRGVAGKRNWEPLTLNSDPYIIWFLISVVEYFLDMEAVAGSNPAGTTNRLGNRIGICA